MTAQDEQSLKKEIQHIFDSGANGVRIFEMVKTFINKRGQALYIHDVSGSLHLVDFIEEIEYMQGLYSNARYTQAEATRDKLAEQLDDLMRLGSNDR